MFAPTAVAAAVTTVTAATATRTIGTGLILVILAGTPARRATTVKAVTVRPVVIIRPIVLVPALIIVVIPLQHIAALLEMLSNVVDTLLSRGEGVCAEATSPWELSLRVNDGINLIVGTVEAGMDIGEVLFEMVASVAWFHASDTLFTAEAALPGLGRVTLLFTPLPVALTAVSFATFSGALVDFGIIPAEEVEIIGWCTTLLSFPCSLRLLRGLRGFVVA